VGKLKLNSVWDLFFGLLLIGLGYWYLSEGEARKEVSKVRQSLFFTGLTLAFVLLVGPVPHKAISTFWVHMIQHIGLMMLISPMLVLGSPVKVAAGSAHPKLQKFVAGALNSGAGRFLFRAEVGFVIFLTVLILTHFSPLANLGMTNPNVHCLELMLFLIGGFIYYFPVMEGNPHVVEVPFAHRVISLFAMMLPETMVGFFLYSGNRVLHSLPSKTTMQMGLADQHKGGAIMWAMGMLIDTVWIVLAARDWFTHEQQLADAEDEL